MGSAIDADESLLGTGGQTIDDIYKYIPGDSRLAMAQRTLEWRHLAPTAPDTLCECLQLKELIAGIYPFPDADPFIIHNRPDIYLIGNQPEFETAIVGDDDAQTRIVMLPSFVKSGLIALVCLETLECKTIGFEIPTWMGEMNGEGNGDVEI